MDDQQNILKNILVPEHLKLSEEEKEKVLKEFNVSANKLPMILLSDAAVQHLNVKEGDIIKIIRNSPTNKQTAFYRVVVHGWEL